MNIIPMNHFFMDWESQYQTPYFRITGNFQVSIVMYHQDSIVEGHVVRKWRIAQRHMPRVNWTAIRNAFTTSPKHTQAKLTKALYKEWDTRSRKNGWRGTMTNGYTSRDKWDCPLCGDANEKYTHVPH